MLAGNFAPAFPIALVEKDFSYATATGQAAGAAMPLAEAARQTFANAIEKGLGEDNITGIVQLYR
jgi:3-hydroxyisobutyrate dehydrogenase-like beta-hydroxyacid dehydrogenase